MSPARIDMPGRPGSVIAWPALESSVVTLSPSHATYTCAHDSRAFDLASSCAEQAAPVRLAVYLNVQR